MNLFLGLSYGRDGETAICGIALTQDDGKSLVEHFRRDALSFADHSAAGELIQGSNGQRPLEDSFGDTVGSVVMFQIGAGAESYEMIQDGDSHWYVIPVNRRADFQRWERAMWNCDDWKEDWQPRRVNGTHTVQFKEWSETA